MLRLLSAWRRGSAAALQADGSSRRPDGPMAGAQVLRAADAVTRPRVG
jgi:hypothetical protein